MHGTLSHANSQLVTRADLMAIPPPPATATWKPIPHYDLIHAIDRQLAVRDIQIKKEEFAIQRGGKRLFGVLELSVTNTDYGFAMGIRASNDKTEAITLVAGAVVFICDNLALSGDLIAMRRRHTARFDLNADISKAIDRYQEHLATFDRQLQVLQERTLGDQEAKLLIYEAFADEALPIRLFPMVVANYWAKEDEANAWCWPRTAWGLHNAFTTAVKQVCLAPAPAFQATTQLGRLFGLTSAG